jgi:hypothetical protein
VPTYDRCISTHSSSTDAASDLGVRCAFIILTIQGAPAPPRIISILYYLLPVRRPRAKMQRAGFATTL